MESEFVPMLQPRIGMEQEDTIRALLHRGSTARIEVGWRKLAASLRRSLGRGRARHAENQVEDKQNDWENMFSHDFNPSVDLRAIRWSGLLLLGDDRIQRYHFEG